MLFLSNLFLEELAVPFFDHEFVAGNEAHPLVVAHQGGVLAPAVEPDRRSTRLPRVLLNPLQQGASNVLASECARSDKCLKVES